MAGMGAPYSRTIIGGLPWYSVLVVSGIVLAVWLAEREEKRLKMPKDTAIDVALLAVPCGIIGARLYYVLMSWEQFAHQPLSALYVWQGGLGIYGGVIGGAVGVLICARRKKLSFWTLADLIVPGLLLAQAVGRWGNYFNMEAYGIRIEDTRLQFFPAAVWIPAEGAWHAATFFYESIWNLTGFAALWLLRKTQKERGNVFAWYLLIYGSGRFIIEQLRMDSLYIGSLRASQWLSLLLCIAAAGTLLYRSLRVKKEAFWLAAGCTALLFVRWAALDRPVLYAALLLSAGVAGLWLVRENRQALLWLMAALLLDGAGLMAAVTEWPFQMAAQGIHAAVCSATLPLSVWALYSRK